MIDSKLEPLATQVVALAKQRGVWLATAESLTGGLLAGTLSQIAGASSVLLGGVVSYVDAVKTQWLGVSPQLIANQSAVDAEVAAQMAAGLLDRSQHLTSGQAVVAISTTGVAGPDLVAGNPVGTVFIGFAYGSEVTVYAEKFEGDRKQIRNLTVARALEILREHLGALPS